MHVNPCNQSYSSHLRRERVSLLSSVSLSVSLSLPPSLSLPLSPSLSLSLSLALSLSLSLALFLCRSMSAEDNNHPCLCRLQTPRKEPELTTLAIDLQCELPPKLRHGGVHLHGFSLATKHRHPPGRAARKLPKPEIRIGHLKPKAEFGD